MVASVLALGGIAGCAAEPSPLAESLVGESFAAVADQLPEDPTYLVQDASPRVGVPPAYTADEFGQSVWTIVAACADAPLAEASVIEIAVIPTESFDAGVRRAISAGEFDDAVSCMF